MSILIKGMEMPSCCDDCWALDEYGDYPVCQITGEQRGYNFRTREKCMDKCPLIEVPTPHGRLGDLDELIIDLMDKGIEGIQMDDWYEAQQAIMDAPTVIEGEPK